jgi:hypothetical protein
LTTVSNPFSDITKSNTTRTGNNDERRVAYISISGNPQKILDDSGEKRAKELLQFCIVGDLEYDGAKCYDFAHTILQRHVMDLTSKMYKKYLENFGMKLLTKIPKDGNLPHDDEQIYINHAKFDISLKATFVY